MDDPKRSEHRQFGVRERARLRAMQTTLFGARALHWLSKRARGAVLATVRPEEAAVLASRAYSSADQYKREASNAAGLKPFEQAAIARCFPPAPARVLVLGCGGGRELRALREVGYVCDGSDPAAELVELARNEVGVGERVLVGGIEDAQQHAAQAPYDAIVVGWGAWGYLLTRRARVQSLRDLAALCPNGPILVSWQMLRRGPTRQDDQHWRRDLRVSVGRGIAAALSYGQVLSEAAELGLTVAMNGDGTNAYPHAVLVQTDAPD